MSEHILLVEDEEAISKPLAFLLTQEGFQVTTAADGESAIKLFERKKFDLILLDLMIPKMSGTEVCRTIRQCSSIPIIMLTAKDTEIDIVVGLELGADDYVTKPYSARELLARIRAVLRRSGEHSGESAAHDTLRGHDIVLDLSRHTLSVRGKEVSLPLREFELLEILMRNRGIVVTRAQLLDRVWGEHFFGATKTIDVHIKRLRSRIEVDPGKPRVITTVRGVGYRFE